MFKSSTLSFFYFLNLSDNGTPSLESWFIKHHVIYPSLTGTYKLDDEISGKYEIIDGKLITYVSEISYENEYYFSDNDIKLHLVCPGIEHTVVYTKTDNYE